MAVQDLQIKMDFLSGQIHAKQQWLADHGHGTKRHWPDHDIDAKRYHLQMLEAIFGDYQRAASKQGQAA